MKESYRNGLTSHPDPESCGVGRKAALEALTGAHAGRVLSCEIKDLQRADDVAFSEGYTSGGVLVSLARTLRSQRPRACMDTPRARTGRPQGCPPRSMVGRLAKAESRTANVYGLGESDGCEVPTKGPNNDGGMASAEGLEGRRPTKENTGQLTRTPDSAPGCCESCELLGVRAIAPHSTGVHRRQHPR